MKKDKRYESVKFLIEKGFIKDFNQIFDHIPRTVVSKDLHKNLVSFTKLLSNPGNFQVKHLVRFAELLEIDPLVLINLLLKSIKK